MATSNKDMYPQGKIMKSNIQSLTIGEKYLYTGTNPSVDKENPLIFIGFNQEQAQFIADDQLLYDLLDEPFSKKAFNNYANKHDIDELSKKTNVITNGEVDLWLSQYAVSERMHALEAEMNKTRALMGKYGKKTFYATDCPGGEVYTQFITEFKKVCSEIGLSTFGFSFHGFENENSLSVAHNGNDVEGDESGSRSHFDAFFMVKNNPKYARMSLSFVQFTNAPELK